MRLRSIEITGFRAISRLALALRDVTVLVGEHDTAKSTVLDALESCLPVNAVDPIIDVSPDDFCAWATAAGPDSHARLSVELTVQESDPGEWGAPDLAPLAAIASRAHADHPRTVSLVAGADRAPSGAITRDLRAPGAVNASAAQIEAAWRALRHAMPVLHLRADRYVTTPDPSDPAPSAKSADDHPMLRIFHDLCQTRGRIQPNQLRDALRDAGSVLGSLSPDLLRVDTNERLSLEAIDSPRAALSRLAGGITRFRPGTGAQAAGVFLLMSMIVNARGARASLAGATPIILIEEPEAHLHPIVSAMSWGLLQELRAQVLATTYSSDIVAATPLDSLRRLIRTDHTIDARAVEEDTLTPDELRRISYHVRIKRGGAFFARCWILVEGETEGWLIPEIASILGYSLPAEGIECIEFAQCGVAPLVKTADALNIAWHLLADGDTSGRIYASAARSLLRNRPAPDHLTPLKARDIEHHMFKSGYAHVYRAAAGLSGHSAERAERASSTIHRAIKATSKPQMALRIAEAVAAAGPEGVPKPLRNLIERAVSLARGNAPPAP